MTYNSTLRVLSIDPGSSKCGTSILDYSEEKTHVIYAETIDAEYLSRYYKDVAFIHGDKYARLIAISRQIEKLLYLYKPDMVISESPFYNRLRPGAYGVLVEVISIIRSTVFNYNPSTSFSTIDPSTIKNALKVKGTSGDKSLMRNALLLKDISYEEYLSPLTFDEHTVDAIAAGLALCILLNTP